jgi:hypothetical protein
MGRSQGPRRPQGPPPRRHQRASGQHDRVLTRARQGYQRKWPIISDNSDTVPMRSAIWQRRSQRTASATGPDSRTLSLIDKSGTNWGRRLQLTDGSGWQPLMEWKHRQEGLRLASRTPVPWDNLNVAMICIKRDGQIRAVHNVTGKREMLEGPRVRTCCLSHGRARAARAGCAPPGRVHR